MPGWCLRGDRARVDAVGAFPEGASGARAEHALEGGQRGGSHQADGVQAEAGEGTGGVGADAVECGGRLVPQEGRDRVRVGVHDSDAARSGLVGRHGGERPVPDGADGETGAAQGAGPGGDHQPELLGKPVEAAYGGARIGEDHIRWHCLDEGRELPDELEQRRVAGAVDLAAADVQHAGARIGMPGPGPGPGTYGHGVPPPLFERALECECRSGHRQPGGDAAPVPRRRVTAPSPGGRGPAGVHPVPVEAEESGLLGSDPAARARSG